MKKSILMIAFVFLILPASAFAETATVAKVNGVAVPAKDLETELNRLIPSATYHGSITGEKRAAFREKAIENLINAELFFQDALAKGLKPDKKKVKARLKQIRDGYRSEKDFKDALTREGMTGDDLRKRVEKVVLVQAVVEKTVQEPAEVAEKALKEYYEKNTDKFKQPEAVQFRMLSTKDVNKANEALAKARAGADFAELAATMSEDGYRFKGGDVGFIHRGRMVKDVEDAAFSMKPGELSGVLHVEDTWSVIKVEEKRPERQMPFEEVKEKLKKELEKKKQEELRDKWIADLRAKAKIEIVDDRGLSEAPQK